MVILAVSLGNCWETAPVSEPINHLKKRNSDELRKRYEQVINYGRKSASRAVKRRTRQKGRTVGTGEKGQFPYGVPRELRPPSNGRYDLVRATYELDVLTLSLIHI